MCTSTYATPTFITEMLTYLQLRTLTAVNGLHSASLLLLGRHLQCATLLRPRPLAILTTTAIYIHKSRTSCLTM